MPGVENPPVRMGGGRSSEEEVTPCQSSSDDEGSTVMRVVVRLVYMDDRAGAPRVDGLAGASELDCSVSESEVVGACVVEVVCDSSSDDRSYVTGAVL